MYITRLRVFSSVAFNRASSGQTRPVSITVCRRNRVICARAHTYQYIVRPYGDLVQAAFMKNSQAAQPPMQVSGDVTSCVLCLWTNPR